MPRLQLHKGISISIMTVLLLPFTGLVLGISFIRQL